MPSALARTINLAADDRGLTSCLATARVPDDFAKSFILKYKFEMLEDFVHYVNAASWEVELKDLVDAVPEGKDNGLILARVKAAWTAGCQAIKDRRLPLCGGIRSGSSPVGSPTGPRGRLPQRCRWSANPA